VVSLDENVEVIEKVNGFNKNWQGQSVEYEIFILISDNYDQIHRSTPVVDSLETQTEPLMTTDLNLFQIIKIIEKTLNFNLIHK
jgi:hypothetical protein